MPQAENKVAFANPESKTMSADEQAQVTTQTESDVATSHKKGGASSGTDGGLKAKEPSERRGSKSKEVTIAKRGPPPPLDLENLLTIMTKLGQGRAFRDVFARFWQYGGRAISGFYLDEGIWWRDLERTGSMCRKWMRFFMPIAAYRAIRQFNSIPKLNPDLKFWMTGESFFNSIYCLVDHVIFLQNINLIKADAVQREWWGRFVEVWWIFEILCALRKENINLQVEKAKERPDSEVLRMIKLRMFKLCCDLYCAVTCVFPSSHLPASSFLRRFKDRILLGVCGAVASSISFYMMWPERHSIESSESSRRRSRRSPSRDMLKDKKKAT